jgi:hypothetical protein
MADFSVCLSGMTMMVEKSRLVRVYGGRESEKEINPAVYPEMRTARVYRGYPAVVGGMGCDGEPVEFRWRVEMSTLSWPFYQEVSRMGKD